MTTAALCAGVLGLLVFGLGIGVSLMRGATDTVVGYNPDPADRLYKMVRAHGNATEYAPMLAILILHLGMHEPGPWLRTVFVAAVASRLLHAAGMIMSPSLARPQPLRFVGALGTYLTGIVLGVAAILEAG